MRKYLDKILYPIILFLVLNTNAQTYPFTNYTIDNGLSQGQILSTFQNTDGVMWFGTSGGGITKFDGKSFEYITDKDGLVDNVVFCIAKDYKGRILIGTNNGLSVYDPNIHPRTKTGRFKNYTTKNGLTHNRIFCINFNKDGVAMLGTSYGVSAFKDTSCSALKISTGIDTSAIFNILNDSKNNLWFSTLGNGVFKHKGKNTTNYNIKDGLVNSMVFSVAERTPEKMWFLTGEGLMELEKNKIKRINPANLDTMATYYSYYKDKRNAWWIGTSIGLIKQSEDGSIKVFRKENGLTDNSFWTIYQDRESNMWFASDQNGVSKLASERFIMYTTKDSLIYDEIKSIYQYENGEFWLGTKIGLTRFKNDRVNNYNHTKLASGSADIWSIAGDKKGNVLICTPNGIVIWNGSGFKRYNCKDKESTYNTGLSVYVDDKEEIWIGTQTGVAKLKDGFIEPFNDLALPKVYINRILQDAKGNYWFCTDEGLYRYDGKVLRSYGEKEGLKALRVKNIVFDANGSFWIATNDGVFKFEGSRFINITNKLGLASNEVYSIIKDNDGRIWAGLSNGLVKIDNSKGDQKIRYYNADDGFLGQVCNYNSILIDQDERLCVGATRGFVIYQKQFDAENTLEPITKIKSIELFFEKTDWNLYTDSVTAGDLPYSLELPYDKNYLTFNFIGVSLTAPDKVGYKFMLKGFDKDWQFGNKTDQSYSNIPPGKYEFILYANNGEGVWNKEPVSFKFEIAFPFWRTWWFYGLIAAIILSGIYSYVKIRAANFQILKQNEIIEEKNETLQFLNLEIAEKNQNITDSINYARRIQRSFITSEKVMNKLLKEHFVLFKPRDIVSGDFYMAFEMHDRTLVVCADSTGHGIPGAFMSLIGISILNEISRSRTYIDTTEILEELRRIIIEALNPERLETGGKDGMDLSLVSIFKKPVEDKIKIHFSGANNSACLVSTKEGKVKMYEYKGDKQPVGYYSNMKTFTHHEILAQKGDIIYMFTDGYADQFGGPRGRKFMSSQLKQQIIAMHNESLNKQREILEKLFVDWQGDLEQIDDVTVMGIKL